MGLHGRLSFIPAKNVTAGGAWEDDDYVVNHTPLTAGEYYISVDKRGDVDTLYRDFSMSVSQVVQEFVTQRDGSRDWSVVSDTVKQMWNSRLYDSLVPIVHAIEPRGPHERELGKLDKLNMPWKSVYFERDGGSKDRVLREGGHNRFPCIVPRWRVTGGDIWGEGPGTKALGSIRQLQVEQDR